MSRAVQALSVAQAQRAAEAQRLLQSGRADAALAIAQAIAVGAPRAPDAHQLLAVCQAESGAAGAAEASFRHALELVPGNPLILTNFAGFLRTQGRRQEAITALRSALSRAADFAQAWISLGQTALELGDLAQARAALERAVRLQPGSALAWRALGNACSLAGDEEAAEPAWRQAVVRSPDNTAGWIGLGHVLRLLGRPVDAVACLQQATQAGHRGPEIGDALAGALLDCGRLTEAVEQARLVSRTYPQFASGQVTLAHLQWEYVAQSASEADPLAQFRAAATNHPDNRPLQLALVSFLLEARQAEEALQRVRTLRAGADHPLLVTLEANAQELLGCPDQARPLYEQAHRVLGDSDPSFLNAYVRHLLKAGRVDAAAKHAAEATRRDPANQEAWAYLGTAWRLLDDPREHWLFDYQRLIALVEVEPPAGYADMTSFLDALQASLAPMHQAKREPVQQSLRGGSQTPGRLFGRPDPQIAAVQAALLAAIERHIATLPADSTHPFLARRSRSVRFTGSWSVKLWNAGNHVNHIHPQGWMSSAFYVALPHSVRAQRDAAEQAGYIQFGQPPLELELGLPPRRVIRPEPGHLALFPSYMWHGTVSFEDDQPRITIAFDMTPRA